MRRKERILFSENAAPRKQGTRKELLCRKLTDGFTGVYELEDGSIMEAHEWLDWDEEWESSPNPPIGAVYYDIYEDGVAVEGGVMGYDKGDKLSDLDGFMRDSSQPGISRMVAPAGSDEYDEIYYVLGDPESYVHVKKKFGFSKNRKSKKKRRRSV